MTSLLAAPPARVDRPSGTIPFMGGTSVRGPPRGRGRLPGKTTDFGNNQIEFKTNAPVKTKYMVAFGSRSKEEVFRGLGSGQFIWGRIVGVASRSSSPGGQMSVVEAFSISALIEFMKKPVNRRLYGSSINSPAGDFKPLGVQAGATEAAGNSYVGGYAEACIDVVAGGFYGTFPDWGHAHKGTEATDDVWVMWRRLVWKDMDLLEGTGADTDSDNDGELASDRKRADLNKARKDYEDLKGLARDDMLALDSKLESAKDELKAATADSDKLFWQGKIKDLKKEMQKLLAAHSRHALAGFADKQYDVSAGGLEHFWTLQPFVSKDRCGPPESLYLTDKCIGERIRMYHVQSTRESDAWSSTSMQQSAVQALNPINATDSFLKHLTSLPQSEILVFGH